MIYSAESGHWVGRKRMVFELTRNRFKRPELILWTAAAAIIIAAAIRYFAQPSFWLDEAFVAVSLRNPSASLVFARLEYGQYFPRIYLMTIALLRETLGYHIWVLRLLPSVSFLAATVLWARLLIKRSALSVALALLTAALFLGSTYWLDQSIQLKQYTFDVLLALVPFLLDDSVYEEALVSGRRRWKLALLALPCILSYTYPLVLGARLAGWYLNHIRIRGWRLDLMAAVILVASVSIALIGLWAVDYRFNFKDITAYSQYWSNCILSAQIAQGARNALNLISKFLWGWHSRMPMVTAGMVPLQILGIYSVIKRWRNSGEGQSRWGSRSLGSIALIGGVMVASSILNYPICAGRVVLFTQVHLQLLAIEGAILTLSFSKGQRVAKLLLYLFIAVVMVHSIRSYAGFIRSEPSENLRPVLKLIDPNLSNTLWVHPCSVAQVRSLPDPLPVEEVLIGTDRKRSLQGKRVWILWSHLGDQPCRNQLQQVREQARSWEIIHEGPGRGLALAEF